MFLLKVLAFDADYGNDITYTLSGTNIFTIHSKLGTVSIPDPKSLKQGLTYQFEAIAFDQDRRQSTKPAKIQVTIRNSPVSSGFTVEEEVENFEDEVVHVERRAVRDDRVFVVRDSQRGSLFSVASIPPVAEERFSFADPAPENLALDEETGVVSREPTHEWDGNMEDFFVNITRIDDPDCKYNEKLLV